MARLSILLAFAFALLAAAGAARAGDIVVTDAVAKLTPSGSGGVFLSIENHGGSDDRLLGVSSPAAKKAALHTTKMDNGVMKMRPVKAIEVPAGETVALQHGGAHVMLFGVAKDLKPGDSLELVLTFEGAGEVPVTATIEAPGMDHGKMGGTATAPVEVTVNLISAEGVGAAIGSLTLAPQDGGVLLTPALTGLAPGPHALHVHTKPNCGPAKKDGEMVAGLAAGGHFDPGAAKKKKHKDGEEGHGEQARGDHGHGRKPAGDLPELIAAADGSATTAIEITTLTMQQMMGRSIMIHAHGEEPADADQPKGGGPRIACAVVPKK